MVSYVRVGVISDVLARLFTAKHPLLGTYFREDRRFPPPRPPGKLDVWALMQANPRCPAQASSVDEVMLGEDSV
jgi:hypothetical protein